MSWDRVSHHWSWMYLVGIVPWRGRDQPFVSASVPTRGARQAASRVAFKPHPKEIKVRKELADIRGRRKAFSGEVYDFSYPYWRSRYPDGDW